MFVSKNLICVCEGPINPQVCLSCSAAEPIQQEGKHDQEKISAE